MVRTPSQVIRLLPDGGAPPDEPAAPEPHTPTKAGSHPACTHALPDISILESYPTPELGFDISCRPHLVVSYFSHFQMSGFRALGIHD
jgi:hypothetical protein